MFCEAKILGEESAAGPAPRKTVSFRDIGGREIYPLCDVLCDNGNDGGGGEAV